MTTQYAVFKGLPTGLTITKKVFPDAVPDTEVTGITGAITERTNAKGEYVVAVTRSAVITGIHTIILFIGSTPIATGSRTFAGTDGETATTTPETAALDSASVNAVADQVWDEAYADHNTAGSFGKLLNTIRKANLTIDGTVSVAVTPTTLTFSSNVAASTSAYAHAVLLFTTGALAGENSPIISYTNTNGVFLLEEPLTSAPSNGDEFVVIAGSHVHSVADIQSGLSTLTAPQVNSEVLDVLSVDTFVELTSPPAATSSLKDKLTWLFMWVRNKGTATATQRKLYADDGTTLISTEAITDDGTTFTKGEAS
jgi:hypothetical protein